MTTERKCKKCGSTDLFHISEDLAECRDCDCMNDWTITCSKHPLELVDDCDECWNSIYEGTEMEIKKGGNHG